MYQGRLIDHNGNTFETVDKKNGCFERGKLNGFGKASFSNGDTYEEEFKDGLFSGKGEMCYKNLKSAEGTYKGMFRNHRREGYGEMIWKGG